MALKTAGTSTNAIMSALQWSPSMSEVDIASFNALCKNDVNVTHPAIPNTFVLQGLLYVPNRTNPLVLRPLDWVVVDPATGFPFVVSNRAMSGADWVHS